MNLTESPRRPFLITPDELEEVWGSAFSPWMRARAEGHPLAYVKLTQTERDQALLKVLKTLDGDLIRSGEHRLASWEAGWRQNLEAFSSSRSLDDLAPRYFGKEPLVRWRQEYIRGLDKTFEYRMFGLLMDWIIDDWAPSPSRVYEFGCGTGHNLLRVRDRYSAAHLTGLDWAETSQEIIRRTAQLTGDKKLDAGRFDYFNPDASLSLDRGATVITVASLEQTGENFKAFVDYLISQPVACVIHVEPMWEFLDSDDLLDYLSIRYFWARNYLNGLLEYLRLKESLGELEILREQRSFVGSFYIDGYSVVMWRPAPML